MDQGEPLYRRGRKTRLRLSTKRKKHHMKEKRQFFAPPSQRLRKSEKHATSAGADDTDAGSGENKTQYEAYVEELRQRRLEAGLSGTTLPIEPLQPGTSSSDGAPLPVQKPKKIPIPPKAPSPLPEAPDTGKRQSGRIYHTMEQIQQKQREEEERKLAEFKNRQEMKRLQEEKRIAAKKKKEENIALKRQSERIAREQQKQRKKQGDMFMEFIRGMTGEYMALPPKRQRVFRITAIMLLNEMLDEQEMEERLATFTESSTTAMAT